MTARDVFALSQGSLFGVGIGNGAWLMGEGRALFAALFWLVAIGVLVATVWSLRHGRA